ncbi:TPA: hypothetical protein QCO67_005414 [Bacillus cereus]|nr:hypothetical protein [Bacillus cereus]HDR3914632.1 hypothetical protein [Bacillus cereus]HDV7172724.1 hypothetical protein [Bacillus cereus]
MKFDISRVDNPDYRYNDYAAAVYKIQSDYTLLPGKGLFSIVGAQYNLPRVAGLSRSIWRRNRHR